MARPQPMTMDELFDLPVAIDLRTAARALKLGRDKAYRLARTGEFPCRVEREGLEYRIARPDLFRALGLPPDATRPAK